MTIQTRQPALSQQPSRAGAVLLPGVPALGFGVERYVAEGGAAAHGDCVHVGRAQVGVVTSGMRSPILRRNIALCRMDVTALEDGTAVEVGKLDGHQKRIPARVVPFPFYDPTKSRVKA